MRRVVVAVAVVALCTVALFANALWVDSQTWGAAQRDGGQIIGTSIVPVNVKVEGTGSPIVLIHGFGTAIGGTISLRSSPPPDVIGRIRFVTL